MELWIRSQDKLKLTKVDYLYVDKLNDLLNRCGVKTGDLILGIYKTKERALEVLDKIHQRLIDLQTVEIAPDCAVTIHRDIDCVYQMPKE